VFDFALKERLQNGNVAEWRHGLNGNPDAAWRQAAVTFVDNHDTGYSPGQYGGQHHWPLSDPMRDVAYTYILLSPGTPTVYWPDMYDQPWRPDPHTDRSAQGRRHPRRLAHQLPESLFRTGGNHQWKSQAFVARPGL
jgi:hypothetical protein